MEKTQPITRTNKQTDANQVSAEKYKEVCRAVFPIAKCFKNSTVVASDKEVVNNHTVSKKRDIER